MKKIIQTVLLKFTLLFLLNVLIFCAGYAQTVDSLNIPGLNIAVSSSSWVSAAIPLPNGQILAGGNYIAFVSSGGQTHTNLVRINSDGSVDDAFTSRITGAQQSGLLITCLTLQTNEQILIGGPFQQINGQTHLNIGRLNADGSLDTNFNAGFVNNSINSILVQPDGQILVGGSFTTFNSKSCIGLCRLNNDGSLDTNFNAGADKSVVAIALQPDGKIVVEGNFTTIGGQSRTNLARLNTDGSIDSGFQSAAFRFFGQSAYFGNGGAVLIQPDGKIVVGGLFDTVNGLTHVNIVRFNVDGTLDTGFNAQADLYNSWGLQTLAIQTDGKILVGDDSQTLDANPCPYFGRLNAAGSLDASFSKNLVFGSMVFSAAIQPDGKILTGGIFSTLGGLPRNNLGRIINTVAANQSLNYDGTNIIWLRGGASPEVWRTSFESSTNGSNWIYLGDGIRISGGWQLTNPFVSTNASIRARGFVAGGRFNGSSWFVESMYPQIPPTIMLNHANLGFRTNQFGFSFGGSAGSTVVIDTSSTLLNWTPIATNMVPRGPLYFNDPTSTNFIQRFYRARLLL